MNSPRIVICSNLDPFEWYNAERQLTRKALFRRLEEYAKVFEFTHRTMNPVEDSPVLMRDPHFVERMVDEETVDVEEGGSVNMDMLDYCMN